MWVRGSVSESGRVSGSGSESGRMRVRSERESECERE